MELKTCCRCKVTLESTSNNFYKDKSKPSGLSNQCRNCSLEISRSRVKSNFERNLKGIEIPDSYTKFCYKCKIRLPASSFHKSLYSQDGLASPCKSCTGSAHKLRNGWTEQAIVDKFKEQLGKCAICDVLLDSKKGKFSTNADHDHKTGKPRGLLCNRCNVGIGHFDDDISLLEKAIIYLRKHV